MVSEIRYFSFKEIRLQHRHPFQVLLGLILLIMLAIAAPQPVLFLAIVTYALSGPVVYLVRLVAGRRRLAARSGQTPGGRTGVFRSSTPTPPI